MIKKDNLFPTGEMTQSNRCIHTPGAFAKQNLLYVQEVGQLKSLKPHKCIREKVDYYLFMVVLEGQGSLEVKGKHYDISQGDCALIDCMEHYEHISDEKNAWKLAWVHFNGYAAKGYYDLFLKYNSGENIFKSQNVDLWNELVGTLLKIQKDRNLYSELRCGEIILHLLNCIMDSVFNTSVMESEQEKQFGNELRDLLNEQYAQQDVLQTIQEKFNGDFDSLDVKFFQQFGISIKEYISNRRFTAAKEMLRFSIKPVEEVAKEAGIAEVQIMQQMFQHNEGMSAEEYRARWAQWIR